MFQILGLWGVTLPSGSFGAAPTVPHHSRTALESETTALARLYATCLLNDATRQSREQAHAALIEAGCFERASTE
jgi:hypothetical protein